MGGRSTFGGCEEMESHHENSFLEQKQQSFTAVFFIYAIDSYHCSFNLRQFSGGCILCGSGNHRAAAQWHHVAACHG
jgi:hypothetical protein